MLGCDAHVHAYQEILENLIDILVIYLVLNAITLL
jgi:hypothetical protein